MALNICEQLYNVSSLCRAQIHMKYLCPELKRDTEVRGAQEFSSDTSFPEIHRAVQYATLHRCFQLKRKLKL